MFEKEEDKLFEYAFGDLDAHDAQIFEASLLKDEVSAEEAKFLQSIKGDLMSFRDIPEMQYSKERLRDAILGQGLKPSKPAFPWLNWVLAPGALACTFALGYVMMHGTSRKDPVYIGPEVADKSGAGPKLPTQELKKPGSMVASNTDEKPGFPDVIDSHWAYDKGFEPHGSGNSSVAKTSSAVEMKYRPSRKHSKSNVPSTSTMVAMNVANKISAAPSGYVASVASLSGSVSSTESTKDTIESTTTPVVDATMILIDKDQDSGVGAPVATEVNDTKNVIVGG